MRNAFPNNALSTKDRIKLTKLIELDRERIMAERPSRELLAKQMSGKMGRGITESNVKSIVDALDMHWIGRRNYQEPMHIEPEPEEKPAPIMNGKPASADLLLAKTRDMSFVDRMARVELQMEAIRMALNSMLQTFGLPEVSQEPF